MDNEVSGTGNQYDYGFRIYDTRIAKFLSVDPLTKSYPMLTPYQFSSNRPIDGIDLDGLEYLDADEARIEMRGGVAHINLRNFNNVTRNFWRYRNETEKWPDGHIGFPTQVGSITHPNLPLTPEPTNIDKGYSGYSDVMHNPTLHQLSQPLRKDWKTPDKRYSKYKPGTVSGGHMTKGTAAATVILNTVNWSISKWITSEMMEDRNLQEAHTDILLKQVMPAINKAKNAGIIPDKYMNIQNIGDIAQVILTGENPTDDVGIYKLGMQIFNEYGENKPAKFEIFEIPETSSDVDNTDVNKTVIIQTQ